MMTSPIRVLVVDDEEIIRSSLQYYLEDEGFEVFTAQDGDRAMEFLAENTVEVGIFDMRMPDIDGNTLIMQVHAKYPQIKCIIYTGSTDYVLPDTMMDIGITKKDVFIKPLLDMGEMVEKIYLLLGREQEN